MQVVVF